MNKKSKLFRLLLSESIRIISKEKEKKEQEKNVAKSTKDR